MKIQVTVTFESWEEAIDFASQQSAEQPVSIKEVEVPTLKKPVKNDWDMDDVARHLTRLKSNESLDHIDLLSQYGARSIIDLDKGQYAPLIQEAQAILAEAEKDDE